MAQGKPRCEGGGGQCSLSLPVPDLSSDSDFPPDVPREVRAKRTEMPPFKIAPQRPTKLSDTDHDSDLPIEIYAEQPLAAPPTGDTDPNPHLDSIQESKGDVQAGVQTPPTAPQVPSASSEVNDTGTHPASIHRNPDVASQKACLLYTSPSPRD